MKKQLIIATALVAAVSAQAAVYHGGDISNSVPGKHLIPLCQPCYCSSGCNPDDRTRYRYCK